MKQNLKQAGTTAETPALSAPAAGRQLRREQLSLEIQDWTAIKLTVREELLSALENLQKREQQTEAIRKGERVKGILHPESVQELRRYFSVRGTQALILRVPGDNKALGLSKYDVDMTDLDPDDKRLFDAVQDAAKTDQRLRKTLTNKKLGVANLEIIDRTVTQPVEQGGLGIQRNFLYRLMHAYMVAECRANGVDMLIACCFRTNKAMRSHAALGWKVLTDASFDLYGDNVQFNLLGLDLRTGQQNRLICRLVAELEKNRIKIVDQDGQNFSLPRRRSS